MLPYAKDLDVQPTLNCLNREDIFATGKFDLNGQVMALGKVGPSMPFLEGNLNIHVKDGRIYRHIPLANLFTFLDVLEIIKKISKSRGLPPGSLVHVGEKKTERVRISVIDYNIRKFEEKEVKNVEECFSFKSNHPLLG